MNFWARHYSAANVRTALLYFLTGKALGAALGILWLVCLVRALPVADYGVYIVLTGYFEIALLATSLGIVSAVERYVPDLRASRGDDEVGSFITGALLVRALVLVLFSIGAIGVSTWVADKLELQRYVEVFLWFQVILFTEGISRLVDSSFDCLLKQKYSQISILTRNALRLCTLVWAWQVGGQHVDLLIWIKLEGLCAIVGLLVALTLLRSQVQLRMRLDALRFLRSNSARYFWYSVPAYGAQLAGLLGGLEAAKLVAPTALAPHQIAQFGFCAMLALMVQRYLPATMLVGMLRPLFVSASHLPTRDARVNQLFSLVVKLNLFVIFPAIAFSWTVGDQLVSLASAGRFTEGAMVLSLLLVYLASQATRVAYNLVMVTLEDGVGTLLALGSGTAVFWAILVMSDPKLGVAVLPLALILGDLVAATMMRFRIYSQNVVLHFPFISICKLLLMALAASFTLSATVNRVDGASVPLTLVGGLTMVLFLYLCIGAWVKPFSVEERESINRILPLRVFRW